jgi:Fe-S oxidoreductase/nitrate reductase gamma subunit
MSTQTAAKHTFPNLTKAASALRNSRPVLKEFVINILAQVRVWRKGYAGIMHALIFWGVTIQVIGTAINLMQMQLFIPFVELPFPRNLGYLTYELVMDLAGVAILIGVLMAAFRRLVLRPKTLETRWDDTYALILLLLIPLAGFTLESLRLISADPAWARWSPMGSIFTGIYQSLGLTPEVAIQLHPYLFWTHVGLGLTLAASIPFTKFRHLIQTPLNILLRSKRPTGELVKIENIEETEVLGVGTVTEFTPRQLLSFDACTRCGRCEEVCPSVISGMPYSPKNLVQSLRAVKVSALESPNGHKVELLGEAIPEELIWMCTTCGACLTVCPGFVNPVDEVIDLRRYQTLTTGKIPKSAADTLRNIERQGNPWGMDPGERSEWLDSLGVRQLEPGDQTDVLLYLGCALGFDERNKKVTRSFIHLLQKAGVDFATLGIDEACCGDTARRLGHEYLFQVLAEQNLETFSKVKFQRIVTQCPHCFNTLKNEYPQFGAELPIQHYTEFLDDMSLAFEAPAGNTNGGQPAITYHDPCYLGRHNQVFNQPRELLDRAHLKQREMARSRENSMCCGGGGGQMWLETDAETRINHQRLQDALATEAGTIATACPYCLTMFDDAIRSKGVGEKVKVLDLAEIIEARLVN